jgi:hypothetical protein
MKRIAAVVLAFALTSSLALAQSASSSAGRSSKAGDPSATADTTGASKSGTTTRGMSVRHHKRSELQGLHFAQAGAPSGRGATTGDPAASSATRGTSPTTGNSMKSNPSGSGTSTSGGKDDNGDQGRDKMPESNKAVQPSNKPGKM